MNAVEKTGAGKRSHPPVRTGRLFYGRPPKDPCNTWCRGMCSTYVPAGRIPGIYPTSVLLGVLRLHQAPPLQGKKRRSLDYEVLPGRLPVHGMRIIYLVYNVPPAGLSVSGCLTFCRKVLVRRDEKLEKKYENFTNYACMIPGCTLHWYVSCR